MGSAFTKPTFDAFAEMLMLEQSKFIDMGILMSSKTKALVASNENQKNQSGKSYTNSKKIIVEAKITIKDTTIFLLTARQFFFQQEGKQ